MQSTLSFEMLQKIVVTLITSDKMICTKLLNWGQKWLLRKKNTTFAYLSFSKLNLVSHLFQNEVISIFFWYMQYFVLQILFNNSNILSNATYWNKLQVC